MNEDFFKRLSVFVLICVGDCADLGVRAIAENGTNGQLFSAYPGFCTAVDLGNVGVNRLRNHWG